MVLKSLHYVCLERNFLAIHLAHLLRPLLSRIQQANGAQDEDGGEYGELETMTPRCQYCYRAPGEHVLLHDSNPVSSRCSLHSRVVDV